MGRNALEFQKFIDFKKIPMVVSTNVPDYIAFAIPEPQALKGGEKVSVMVTLTNDDTYADMYIYDIAVVKDDEAVKNKLYRLFNELNSTYKFISFYEAENTVNAKCSIPFNNNFNAELIMDILSVLFRAVEEEYDKIIETI